MLHHLHGLDPKFPTTLMTRGFLQGHLDEARRLKGKLKADTCQLMLGAVGCGLYLQALEKHNFQIMSPALQHGAYSPLWHLLNVKYCLLRGSF